MDKILEFLFYQTPQEYELMFGDVVDPNDRENTRRSIDFLNHLQECTLPEYCHQIVKALLTIYPSSSMLRFCLLDFDDRGLFLQPDRPRRSAEITRIDFIYKKAKLYGRFDPKTLRNLEYLDELKVTFKTTQPQLSDWVEQALAGKAFNKTNNSINTIFKVSNSPILNLVVETKSFTIFIDKKTFIEYLFQSRSYDE
jgi:hypothetical protein